MAKKILCLKKKKQNFTNGSTWLILKDKKIRNIV